MTPAEETLPTEAARPRPTIRLTFGSLFWRVVVVSFVIWEILLWAYLKRMGLRKQQRIARFLLFSPRMLGYAFMLGAAITVATSLLVRLVLAPLIRRWHTPRRPDDVMGAQMFYLGANEPLLAEAPARLQSGRLWHPGTLILTNSRIGFFPFAWDAPPWLVPLDQLRAVRVEPASSFAFGMVKGLPDRLVLQDASEAERRFAVADPLMILDWLDGYVAPQFLHFDGPLDNADPPC
ncbi:MAG: hypothetical protein ABI353_07445 [Isosphaeraceae bacterium]